MNPSRTGERETGAHPALPPKAHDGLHAGMTLAVAGKGGVGKTTFAALLVRALLECGVAPVLAVDADPNSNLGQLLGLEAQLTVGALRERTFSGPQAERERPAGWDARSWVEYRMQEAVAEGQGMDLLVMGRPEGPGCYCYANSLLREYLQSVAAGYQCVVVDNEAGLEHLSRRLCRTVDVLFVLDDGSRRARQAAGRILELAREVDVLPRRAICVTNGARPLPAPAGREPGRPPAPLRAEAGTRSEIPGRDEPLRERPLPTERRPLEDRGDSPPPGDRQPPFRRAVPQPAPLRSPSAGDRDEDTTAPPRRTLPQPAPFRSPSADDRDEDRTSPPRRTLPQPAPFRSRPEAGHEVPDEDDLEETDAPRTLGMRSPISGAPRPFERPLAGPSPFDDDEDDDFDEMQDEVDDEDEDGIEELEYIDFDDL